MLILLSYNENKTKHLFFLFFMIYHIFEKDHIGSDELSHLLLLWAFYLLVFLLKMMMTHSHLPLDFA